MLRTVIVVAAAILALWIVFVAGVAVVRSDETSIRDALRLLPDTARVLRRLAADRTVPRRTRWLLWALIAYLASPIDLIPDFIPVVGHADDAIITSFVLRRVIAKAGAGKLDQHWPGSPEGLAALRRLLRLDSS